MDLFHSICVLFSLCYTVHVSISQYMCAVLTGVFVPVPVLKYQCFRACISMFLSLCVCPCLCHCTGICVCVHVCAYVFVPMPVLAFT